MNTFEQKMAEKAFALVSKRDDEEYRSFALSFPSMIHSCGLVQAVAFAVVKNKNYLRDLTEVLKVVEADLGIDLPEESRKEEDLLPNESRKADVMKYMRLSRRALSAASWLKRYVQALDKDKTGGKP
jgi:CRISPR-associated protein Cmr5